MTDEAQMQEEEAPNMYPAAPENLEDRVEPTDVEPTEHEAAQDVAAKHDDNQDVAAMYGDDQDDDDTMDAAPKPEVEKPAREAVEQDDGALWSSQDVAEIRSLETELLTVQQQGQAFAQAKAKLNLEELEKTDKARAVALKIQMREAERELQERYKHVVNQFGALQGKATAAAQKRAERQLEAERKMLLDAVPDFDGAKTSAYLERIGFNRDDLSQLTDHRMAVVAEKARRYDELMAKQQDKPLPKLRKGKAQVKDPNAEYREFEKQYAAKRKPHDRNARITDFEIEAMYGPEPDRTGLTVPSDHESLRVLYGS